jgi:hypothetical protein
MKARALSFLLLAVAACGSRSATTPAQAHARLVAAVSAHDSTLLWNALDQETQWSWMSIQRAWREAYDITQSVVPEGPERTRLLARYEPGATSEDARALFARMLTSAEWTRLQGLVNAAGSKQPTMAATGERSELDTPLGPLLYRKGHDKHAGWGYAGLDERAEQVKFAASADLERMRRNAADYERAATRGAM